MTAFLSDMVTGCSSRTVSSGDPFQAASVAEIDFTHRYDRNYSRTCWHRFSCRVTVVVGRVGPM